MNYKISETYNCLRSNSKLHKMPLLEIATNVSKDKISADNLAALSKALCETIGKPEQYCSVHVLPDQLLMFGGSSEPCAQVKLMSIGKLGTEENKVHSANLADVIEKILGVKSDRMYIQFIDKSTSEIGYKGTTFHQLKGK